MLQLVWQGPRASQTLRLYWRHLSTVPTAGHMHTSAADAHYCCSSHLIRQYQAMSAEINFTDAMGKAGGHNMQECHHGMMLHSYEIIRLEVAGPKETHCSSQPFTSGLQVSIGSAGFDSLVLSWTKRKQCSSHCQVQNVGIVRYIFISSCSYTGTMYG